MAEKKTCFIAMPLTTPASKVEAYGGDPDHFLHVLEFLHVPAVEAAGYEAIRPLMTGADVIHAEIIRHLEEADLVLVDISGHNPNVFFELGIRTSLDRPVALISDHLTGDLPFDTSIINTLPYDGTLRPWTLESQKLLVKEHIAAAGNKGNSNPLWRYFGLTRRAEEADAEVTPQDARTELLQTRLDALERLVVGPPGAALAEISKRPAKRILEQAFLEISEIAAEHGLVVLGLEDETNSFTVTLDRRASTEAMTRMHTVARSFGRDIAFTHGT